ncbi:MAG: OsmC family protein [Rhodospirillaceae bacterium]|jgi:putative redox protein|nr:OsmC family protein [Rhodospirillaceae bacterium]MBT5459867.1 OsmC family protein [Rhodospirillaceae bacterium]
MTDRDIPAELLAPSVDPETKKLGIRTVTGRNDAGTRTEVKVRHFDIVATDEPDTMGGTNTAPSPLENVLVSLVGCDGVIINGVADAMGFAYTGADFECSGQVDVRGPKGVPGIRPYFEKVDIKITLHTDEPADRIRKLQDNVEFRCPVMNLLRSADVDLGVTWVVEPAE